MKSKLHTYVAVSISNHKAIFTYTINVVVATNHTDGPVVSRPGNILKMGGYAVMQPVQEHMQGMQTPWGQFHTANCRLVRLHIRNCFAGVWLKSVEMLFCFCHSSHREVETLLLLLFSRGDVLEIFIRLTNICPPTLEFTRSLKGFAGGSF